MHRVPQMKSVLFHCEVLKMFKHLFNCSSHSAKAQRAGRRSEMRDCSAPSQHLRCRKMKLYLNKDGKHTHGKIECPMIEASPSVIHERQSPAVRKSFSTQLSPRHSIFSAFVEFMQHLWTKGHFDAKCQTTGTKTCLMLVD